MPKETSKLRARYLQVKSINSPPGLVTLGGTTLTADGDEVNILDGATVTYDELNLLDGASGYPINSAEVTFTETAGAGVWTGDVTIPAGATLLDILVNAVALWNSETSATMIVGDVADPNGFYAAVNLKATDLLAGESISFALAGGKAGAYIAASQVSPRYMVTERVITGEITKVGTTGTAGRTRMTVLWALCGSTTAATKV